MAQLRVSRPEPVQALEKFLSGCQRFVPESVPEADDLDEIALEEARNDLAYEWLISQRLEGDQPVVVSNTGYPSLKNAEIQLDVASLGEDWVNWPTGAQQLVLGPLREWQLSDFLEVRLRLRKQTCAWIQLARFVPPIDHRRDHAVIARYLDLATYFLWLRTLLADEQQPGGGEWDAPSGLPPEILTSPATLLTTSMVPTLEEILRSWARNPAAFAEADSRVTDHLEEMERRVTAEADLKVLSDFRKTWSTIASGLR